MKLKLVVASMSVLGLISCPAFAATQAKHKTQKVTHEEVYKGDYKGEMMPMCPRVDVTTTLMDMMSQNVGRAKPTVDCDKPIQLAGGINFDTNWGALGDNDLYMGENDTRFTLNDAYINFTGNVNDWVHAFIELSYNNVSDEDLFHDADDDGSPAVYSAAYTLEALDLEQGVITVGNLDRMPVFLRVGKQFFDYGRYQIHPIMESMTQTMTEILNTGAEVGYIAPWGNWAFHGSAFVFQNPIVRNDDGVVGVVDAADPDDLDIDLDNTQPNYGGQIGFGQVGDQFGWDVGVGYLYDITGVNDVGYSVTQFNKTIEFGEGGAYDDRVGGLTAYAMVNSGPFAITAHYATALQHFDAVDLLNPDDDDDADADDEDGAKPWTADITAGYDFNYYNYNQNIYLGYQFSGEAQYLNLPRSRWQVGYGIDIFKNTNLTVEYDHDNAYDFDDVFTGEEEDNDSNKVALRLAVKFG